MSSWRRERWRHGLLVEADEARGISVFRSVFSAANRLRLLRLSVTSPEVYLRRDLELIEDFHVGALAGIHAQPPVVLDPRSTTHSPTSRAMSRSA